MPEVADRNVFILGAGFSAHAGAPLIRGFLDRARELMDDPSSGLEPFERQRFNRVFEFRREMAQAREKVRIDLDNIEELFGLVEISQRLGQKSRDTRDSTVYVIAKTLQLAIKPPGNGRGRVGFDVRSDYDDSLAVPDFNILFPAIEGRTPRLHYCDIYEYFAALSLGFFDDSGRQAVRANTFITFNYDLVLDHALQRLGVRPEYCLDAERTRTYEIEHKWKSPLLKLHGSTNWGVCGNCLGETVVLQGKVTDSVNQFREETCSKCGAQQFQPLLIPPSWDKSEYQSIMTPVWAKAVAELKSASRICIIGYSMPQSDLFFKYLLTVALAQNHRLYKLIVVDIAPPSQTYSPETVSREPNELEKKYSSFLDPLFIERRFTFNSQGFERFIASHFQAIPLIGRGEALGGNIGLY